MVVRGWVWGFIIKQPTCHLDRDLRENGKFGWKNENPCLENFFVVPGQKLALGEVEESQGFSEVKHSKYKNGFSPWILSIDSFLELSSFLKLDEQKPR